MKEQMKKGTAEPSFVERMLRRLEHEKDIGTGEGENSSQDMEELIGYAAAALYVGGADTVRFFPIFHVYVVF